MKSKLAFVLLSMFICFGLTSCSKDDDSDSDPCSVFWTVGLSDEINAFSLAAQAYGTNPTLENCNAYKAAAQAYVNALSPYGDCASLTGQDRVSWQESLIDAQQSVNEITCTEE
jgi:hypothetical protein